MKAVPSSNVAFANHCCNFIFIKANSENLEKGKMWPSHNVINTIKNHFAGHWGHWLMCSIYVSVPRLQPQVRYSMKQVLLTAFHLWRGHFAILSEIFWYSLKVSFPVTFNTHIYIYINISCPLSFFEVMRCTPEILTKMGPQSKTRCLDPFPANSSAGMYRLSKLSWTAPNPIVHPLLLLFLTWVVGASQPAQECRGSIRNKLNSNNLCDVYMSVVHEMSRTPIIYLYSSVKPSSC